MKWLIILETGYLIIMLLVIFRVLYDTRSSVKALPN